jgi:hypothetical protein
MKKSTLAVAALLTTLSASTIVPAAYADNATTTQSTAPCTGCKGCAGCKGCGSCKGCTGCGGSGGCKGDATGSDS